MKLKCFTVVTLHVAHEIELEPNDDISFALNKATDDALRFANNLTYKSDDGKIQSAGATVVTLSPVEPKHIHQQ